MSSLKIICLYISPLSGQIRLLSIIIASDRGQTLCLRLSLWYLHPQNLGLQPLWFVRLCNLLAVNRVLVHTPTSDSFYVTFWWIAFPTMSCVSKYGVMIVTYHKVLLCIVLLSGRLPSSIAFYQWWLIGWVISHLSTLFQGWRVYLIGVFSFAVLQGLHLLVVTVSGHTVCHL